MNNDMFGRERKLPSEGFESRMEKLGFTFVDTDNIDQETLLANTDTEVQAGLDAEVVQFIQRDNN